MLSCCCFWCLFFFFKQKTAYEMRISDWSSDVCSSDLLRLHVRRAGNGPQRGRDSASRLAHRVQVVAIELDRHIRANARDQLVEPHLDRLLDLGTVADQRLHPFLDPPKDILLGDRKRQRLNSSH